jgi:hypothetical protein
MPLEINSAESQKTLFWAKVQTRRNVTRFCERLQPSFSLCLILSPSDRPTIASTSCAVASRAHGHTQLRFCRHSHVLAATLRVSRSSKGPAKGGDSKAKVGAQIAVYDCGRTVSIKLSYSAIY